MTTSTQSAEFALALPHAVANDLAAAELDLVAVDRVIGLDLDDELGVAEPHAVARRRAEHVGVSAARNLASWRQRPHDAAKKAVDAPVAGVARRARRCAPGPARSARPCPRECSSGSRASRRDRTRAPRWSRRSGSASRLGSAGRRCCATLIVSVARPTLSSISPSSMKYSPGVMR